MIRRESNPSPLQVPGRNPQRNVSSTQGLEITAAPPRCDRSQELSRALHYHADIYAQQFEKMYHARNDPPFPFLPLLLVRKSSSKRHAARFETRRERERENSDQERTEKDGGKSLINKQNSRRLVTNWCIGDGIRGLGRYLSAQWLVKQT